MAIVDNKTPNQLYPLPDATNNLSDDVLRLQDAIGGVDADVKDLRDGLSGKAPAEHIHPITDVTNLPAALDAKADKTHQHAIKDLTDVNAPSSGGGQVLRFNSVTSKWEPSSISADDLTVGTVSIDRLPVDELMDGGTY